MGGILLGIVFFFLVFLLIGLILLQEGKGGGITAMGGAEMDGVMGVRNPLRRWTAYLSIAFVVVVMFLHMSIAGRSSGKPKGETLNVPAVAPQQPQTPVMQQPSSSDVAAEVTSIPVELQTPPAADEATPVTTEPSTDGESSAPAETTPAN